MTAIYIAFSASGESRNTFSLMDWDEHPVPLLVSYFYKKEFERVNAESPIKSPLMMLDSGAFSAYQSGSVIDIDSLIEETKNPRWHESVALDVIGDPEGSLRNALYMQKHGSPAYPVFHIGEPWDLLVEYCQRFDKVGLSCRFGEPVSSSMTFYEQCFARTWPHKFHSFGWVSRKALFRFPFHSADCSSWNTRPTRFGLWTSFKHSQLSIRGQKDLRSEVQYYYRLGQELGSQWADELARFNVPKIA